MAGVASSAPSPEGWQLAKPLIQQLYVQQDRPLKEVRAYLAEHRNFLATERMFKQRLKEWGFDRKKVKAAEWRYMLRLTRQRRGEGKDSAFHVNGKVIVWSNIRKHLKRKKKTEDEFLSAGPEGEVVEDVICYTPPGSPHLSMTSTTSSQALAAAHGDNYPSQSPSYTITDDWRGLSSTHSFSPESEPSNLSHTNLPSCLSPSAFSDCSSIPDPELQSIALRPITIKTLPPLDEAAAFRISRLMSGSHNQAIPTANSELPSQRLTVTLNNDRASAKSARSSFSVHEGNAVLWSGSDEQLSDEDMASRWVVYYFQACICESQGDHEGMQGNVKEASKVFKSMIKCLNTYLLTGLTLMTSILYFHDHTELLQQFLENSCQVIENEFSSNHPILVPYRYMLLSVSGEQGNKSAMTHALDIAHKAFQLTWGKVHSNTLTALYYHGCSLLESNRFKEAEKQLQECFQLSQENLGPSHFLTVWTLATISRTLSTSNTNREADAVRYLQAAISRCRRMMHEEHPYYLELNRNLATIYLKLGNMSEVEKLYRFVLKGRINMLGLGREITKASVDDLYDILVARNKLQEAAQLRADIVALEDRGEGHSSHGISY